MSYSDMSEQAAIIRRSSHRLIVRVFASTGKTSMLVRFIQVNPNCRMFYLAYNCAVRDEAEQKSPFNVECKASHQTARPNFWRHYRQRLTANLRITEVARQLNTCHWPLAHTSITTFNAFLCSGGSELGPQHLPDEDARSGLSAEIILAAAQLLWCESARQNGTFPVTNDVYLKLYQLSQPDLSRHWQTLLFDEGQDANPVTQSLVLAQCCNVVLVSDRHQQIYRFRGAENALDVPQLADADQLCLTHSVRFDPAVAWVANRLLARQGETVSVVGEGRSEKVLAFLLDDEKGLPVAVLSCTVAVVIGAALDASLAGKKVYWVGGIVSYKTYTGSRRTYLSISNPRSLPGTTATLRSLRRWPERPTMRK